MKCLLAAITLSVLLIPATMTGQEGGLTTQWDIRETLKSLNTQTGRLLALLEQVDPAAWTEKGASESYVEQWKGLTAEISYLQRSADELSAKPDRMTKTLEAFLRLQAVEQMMGSFVEGIHRYHNPAVADLLTDVMNESAENRHGLQNYLVELVAQKEVELKSADQEAQRCRAELIK